MNCNMRSTCLKPVTHIGEKGYIYCTECAGIRQGYERCRKMRAWELKLIKAGKPIPSYEYHGKPTPELDAIREKLQTNGDELRKVSRKVNGTHATLDEAYTATRRIMVPENKLHFAEHKLALFGHQFALLRGMGYIVAVFKASECIGYLDSVEWGYRNARDMAETIPQAFIE